MARTRVPAGRYLQHLRSLRDLPAVNPGGSNQSGKSNMRKAVIACSITALAVGAGTASASVVKLITSKDIADSTIQNRDIDTGAISLNRLTPGVQALLDKAGQPGKDGVDGSNGTHGHDGSQGSQGSKGDKGST